MYIPKYVDYLGKKRIESAFYNPKSKPKTWVGMIAQVEKKPVNTGLFEPWSPSRQRFGNRISLFTRKELSDFKGSQIALFAFWIFLVWFQKRFLQRDERKWFIEDYMLSVEKLSRGKRVTTDLNMVLSRRCYFRTSIPARPMAVLITSLSVTPLMISLKCSNFSFLAIELTWCTDRHSKVTNSIISRILA